MANMGFTPQSLIAPDLQTQLQQNQRAQALAQMLQEQSLQTTPTQMVSGRVVPNGIGMGLEQLARALLGRGIQKKADSQSADLNTQMAQRYASALARTVPGSTENVLSQGQNAPGDMNIGSVGPTVDNAEKLNPQSNDISSAAISAAMMGNTDLANQITGKAWDWKAPTQMEKENQYLGIPTNLARALQIAKMNKEGTQSLLPGQTNIMPSGNMFVAPDFSKGTQGGFDTSGNPIMGGIPGNQVIAQLAGQQAAQVKGAELPFQSPTTVNTPQGPKLMTPAQQIAAANGTGGLSLMTPEVQKLKEAAADATINAAKMSAASQPLLQIIQQAKAIANDVPSGSFGAAEAQAKLSGLPVVGNKKDAQNAALWNQMMGQSILSTIQNLAQAGGIRMDIPIVQEIQKAGGIPLWLPPQAKIKMLEQLESEVRNKLSAAVNTVPALNNSDLNANLTQPMQNPPSQPSMRRFNPATGKIE